MIILVVGYNRPHYYKKCINAIKANSPKRVIVSVDGGDKEAQAEYRRLTPSNYEFIAHPENLGIAHHLFEMRDLVFAQTDRMLMIEDDVVVAPNYVTFIEQLLDWSEQYDDVGAVTGWKPCFLEKDEKRKKARLVGMHNTNWITYGMKRRCWFDIRDDMQEYLDRFIRKGHYRQRPNQAIRDWGTEKFVTPEKICDNPFPRHKGAFWAPGMFQRAVYPSSQDGVLVGSFHLRGWKKINTIVNRCVYIGEKGEHGTPQHFRNRKFGEMKLDVFKETGKFKAIGG